MISRQKLIEERNAVAERFEALDRALRTGNYYDECCDVDEFITEDDIAVAVEALSQPPADQCVPLSEVYRVIAGHSDYHGDNILAALTCIAAGKEVKPVRPLPPADQWIPCSERLPDKSDFYVVTFELDCELRLCQCEYFDIENNIWFTPYNVIAWKERAEPYKGVE